MKVIYIRSCLTCPYCEFYDYYNDENDVMVCERHAKKIEKDVDKVIGISSFCDLVDYKDVV